MFFLFYRGLTFDVEGKKSPKAYFTSVTFEKQAWSSKTRQELANSCVPGGWGGNHTLLPAALRQKTIPKKIPLLKSLESTCYFWESESFSFLELEASKVSPSQVGHTQV